MIKLKNKFAIGCLIQWYEIELIPLYLESVKQALDHIENKENVIVDLYFNCSQVLEKIDESQMTISQIRQKYKNMLINFFEFDEDNHSIVGCKYNINSVTNAVTDKIYTIADYRREFNDKYCEEVDVLMWGETDSLIPRQTFEVLDNLHNGAQGNNIYKYVAFFGTCKMWDKSWEPVEHTEFTVKEHREDLQGDPVPWWDVRHNSTLEEMNRFNDKVEDIDIRILNQPKFNGCGLIISSDLIKSGVNIPRSVFFVHEDTAFQNIFTKLMGNQAVQFVIKNVFLVHNRRHPDKRMYVLGESGETVNRQRMSNDWYAKGNKWCEQNAYNMFNQTKDYKWRDILDE
jgi:hypothetical protein